MDLMSAIQGSAVEYMKEPSIQAVMWFFCSLGMLGLWPVRVSYWALQGGRISLLVLLFFNCPQLCNLMYQPVEWHGRLTITVGVICLVASAIRVNSR